MVTPNETRAERMDEEATDAVIDRAGETRETVRDHFVAKIPRWYSPWLHLAATSGIGVTLLVLGAVFLHGVKPLELLFIPAMIVIANGVEWYAHRDALHKRFPLLGDLYEQHMPVHHRVYHEVDMAMLTYREMRYVLIPAVGIVGIVLALAPMAVLAGWVFGPNCGWLALVTTGLYVVSYELLHLSYHLPHDHPVAKLRVMRWLSRHHARHHDPHLMQRWNFNVTLPLFDWIHGTVHTPEREAKRVAATRAQRHA